MQIQTIGKGFEAFESKFKPLERDSKHSNANSNLLKGIRSIWMQILTIRKGIQIQIRTTRKGFEAFEFQIRTIWNGFEAFESQFESFEC